MQQSLKKLNFSMKNKEIEKFAFQTIGCLMAV